jgi:hypothetical protein
MADVIARVANLAAGCPARAVLLRHGRLLAATELRDDGGYVLRRADPADEDVVVIQQTGTCIRAAASRAERAPAHLPDAMAVTITAVSPPPGAVISCDPVTLDGFPDDLLWSLRTGADATVMLHVVECPAARQPLQLLLQPGIYRLAGGVIGLHPGQQSMVLARVTGPGHAELTADGSGSVSMQVDSDLALTAEFGPAPS